MTNGKCSTWIEANILYNYLIPHKVQENWHLNRSKLKVLYQVNKAFKVNRVTTKVRKISEKLEIISEQWNERNTRIKAKKKQEYIWIDLMVYALTCCACRRHVVSRGQGTICWGLWNYTSRGAYCSPDCDMTIIFESWYRRYGCTHIHSCNSILT